MKQVQNAWDYMRKKNCDILSEFKPSSTSNDRTGAVTVEAQKHYFDVVIEAQRLAASLSKDEVHWKALADNFVLALDESCFMAAIEGGMIVGDRKKRKHCKSTQNSRVSITVVECGNAAGCDGPSMYLMQGQIPGNLKGLFGNSSWLEKSGAPPRSFVVPTPTAYMTDDAWDAAAEPLASGIRGMSVIKDYPN